MMPNLDSSDDPYGAPGDVGAEIGVVEAIYEAFARRDVEAALDHMAEDVELILPATASRSGRDLPYRGHDGVREYFADLAQVWQELLLRAADIRAISGAVVVFGSVQGRAGSELISRNVVWTWKLRDGQAVSVRANEMPAT
jgi:ketosteroid isomerase-like protein